MNMMSVDNLIAIDAGEAIFAQPGVGNQPMP